MRRRKQPLSRLAGAALLAGLAQTAAAENLSTIDQIDAGNSATVNQTLTGVTQNKSTIKQDRDGGASGNTATVTQLNAGLPVIVGGPGATGGGPPGSFNRSSIDQKGSGHSATVNQTALGYGDNGQPAPGSDILQRGTNQSATVNQTATQRGDNKSVVDQRNSGNSAGVTQIANTNVISGSDNDSRIDQRGIGNQATVVQTSNGNTDNTSLINQRASSNNGDANVQQSGNGPSVVNNSDIDQSGGTNNSAGVTQSGLGTTHNLSTVVQTGSFNGATIGQSGTSLTNTSTLHQTGISNGATVTQN
jgi:trimeric autotransporter adhesin